MSGKISELTLVAAPLAADLIEVVEAGVNKRATLLSLPLSTVTTNALALKAPLASPAFTGALTADGGAIFTSGTGALTAPTLNTTTLSVGDDATFEGTASFEDITVTGTVTGLDKVTQESLSNASGNTTITVPVDSKRHTVYLTYTGDPRTSIIIISTTNAEDAAAVRIVSYFPTTAGIVQQVRNATVGGTVLDTTTSDASGRKASVEFGYNGTAWTSNGGAYPA